MKFTEDIKYELRCTDIKYPCVFAAVSFLLGTLSAILGGSSVLYNYIMLPRHSPSRLFFVLVWSFMYVIFGCAVGFIVAKKSRMYETEKYKALVFCAISFCFSLIWYPMFFSAKAFFLCFIACIIIAASDFAAAIYARRTCKISFLLFSVYFIWLLYCLVLNFMIFLLN